LNFEDGCVLKLLDERDGWIFFKLVKDQVGEKIAIHRAPLFFAQPMIRQDDEDVLV
jgi:hypothetical protein